MQSLRQVATRQPCSFKEAAFLLTADYFCELRGKCVSVRELPNLIAKRVVMITTQATRPTRCTLRVQPLSQCYLCFGLHELYLAI